CYTEGDYW
nr:immunoglobulin heavy chain junction region [Macaca mulatta]MPN70342.1 immunoglobulin heavy chain junction region [Macaca mulatta]MPN70528.1 immunoglobulin heavy chain junction region [Macaca mulatta]MPN70600.1 immunoglobulin heavy chain junction region [Macaca mulatta]MPN70909.1 immunoglobulin heavy chain junction region [Macaca mulatta]